MIDKPRPAQKQNNPQKPAHLMNVTGWPARKPDGLGLSFKDGWNFGTGLGLALAVAVPLIMAVAGCLIFAALTVFGGAVGQMLN